MDKILKSPKVRNTFSELSKCKKTKCSLKTSQLSKLIERTTRLKCTQKLKTQQDLCRTKYFIKNQLKMYLKAVPECMKTFCSTEMTHFKQQYLSASRELQNDLEKLLSIIELQRVPSPSGKKKTPNNLHKDYVKYSVMPKEKAKMYIKRRIMIVEEMIVLFSKL